MFNRVDDKNSIVTPHSTDSSLPLRLSNIGWCNSRFAIDYSSLIDLASVGASLCETGLSAGGLAEHDIAVPTQDNSLGMAEDCGNLKASWALNVHEEAVWRLNKPLQLVCAGLLLRGRV
jgi:hypothetical protein